MEDTRQPKCVMFGEMLGGAGCVGGQEKEWMGCFLDDLRAFGINADQWTTTAQDEGEWRRKAEQGGRTFHGKMDRCRKKQGWTTACSGMPERDGKDQGEDSPKQAGSRWFARPCCLATSGANLCPPGVWFADVMTSFSGVPFVLFCFVFVFMLSLKPRPFVQSSFDMQAPRHPHVFFFLFFIIWRCRFFRVFFVPFPLSLLYGEYVVRSILLNGV